MMHAASQPFHNVNRNRVPMTWVYPSTKPFVQDFVVPPLSYKTVYEASGDKAFPGRGQPPVQEQNEKSFIDEDALSRFSDMPFLKSQILIEESGEESSKQELARCTGKNKRRKRSYTSPNSHSGEHRGPQQEGSQLSYGRVTHAKYYHAHGSALTGGEKPKDRSRPRDPERLQSALRLISPKVLYARYNCVEGCRSRGICLHISFLLCGRSCPDGLICEICRISGHEEGYVVERMCSKHHQSTASQHTSHRPEDSVAKLHEISAAQELLRKAWTCDWNDKFKDGPRTDRSVIADNMLPQPKSGLVPSIHSPYLQQNNRMKTHDERSAWIDPVAKNEDGLENFEGFTFPSADVSAHSWSSNTIANNTGQTRMIDELLSGNGVALCTGDATAASWSPDRGFDFLLMEPVEV